MTGSGIASIAAPAAIAAGLPLRIIKPAATYVPPSTAAPPICPIEALSS